MHCLWWPSVTKQCQQGMYTVQPDFEYLLTRLPPGDRAPSAKNTLWFDKWDPGAVSTTTYNYTLDPTGDKYARDKLTTLSPEEALAQARAKEGVPVLYLGTALRLKAPLAPGEQGEKDAFGKFKDECEWLRDEYIKGLNERDGRRLREKGLQPAQLAAETKQLKAQHELLLKLRNQEQ